MRQLDHQQQREIEVFRAAVTAAISQKNLDFQAWKFEQEITLQKELSTFNRETQFANAAYQRETTLKAIEANRIADNWPLKNMPTEILESHPNHLRVIISPPELDYDRFTHFTGLPHTHDPKNAPPAWRNFPRIESFLGSRLRKLLNQHYPRNNALRPTQFLGRAWDSRRFAEESSIIALAHGLESEPLVVLETKVTFNKLSLQVAYKGIGTKNYFYDEIIPYFDYSEILYGAAKTRYQNKSLSDAEGIKIIQDDWLVLYELLEIAHCIVTAWIADVHHLFYYNAEPLLPDILPELLKNLPEFILADEKSIFRSLLQEVIQGYQEVFHQLTKTDRYYQVPELLINLAQSIMHFDDKLLLAELADNSMQNWLKIKGIEGEVNNLNAIAIKTDIPYLTTLAKVYQSVDKPDLSSQLTEVVTSLQLRHDPIQRFVYLLGDLKMSSTALKNLKLLFQDRPEVLKMLDLRELDLSNLSDERMVEEQRKRKLFPEPVNLYATGRTRAGKSSLGNSLFGPVLPTTGHTDCTSFVQFFEMASNLRYYDLPGAGSNEDFENINRVALLVPQLDDPDEDMIPVKELEIHDFSKSSTNVGEPILIDGKNPSVEHWQSPENQSVVAPDVILYVIAPHEGVGRDDRRYLTALLRSLKARDLENNIVFALNIHRHLDGTMKATPQNIEDVKKLIRDAYKKLELSNIPSIVEINALKGTGINQITETMCQFLPSNKIGNMQQVLQEQLKQYAEKERSRRYRQTLIYIASRLATYKVDTQLGTQNLLHEAYAAICNYGVMIFHQQKLMAKAEMEFYDLIKDISSQAKVSREEAIKILEQITEERDITQEIITHKPQYENVEVEDTVTTYVEAEESHQETYTHKDDVAGGAVLGGGAGAAAATIASIFMPIAAPIFLGAAALGAAGGAAAGTQRRTRTVTENVMKPAKSVVKRIQKELVGYEEEKQTVLTGNYQAVIGEREREVGKKSKQGGYLVLEDLLAIGLGLEHADFSIDFKKNFSSIVETGRLTVQGSLLRYKDHINKTVEEDEPEKAEQAIIDILQKALMH